MVIMDVVGRLMRRDCHRYKAIHHGRTGSFGALRKLRSTQVLVLCRMYGGSYID